MSDHNQTDLSLHVNPDYPNRLPKELSDVEYVKMRAAGTLGVFFGFPKCCQQFFEGKSIGPSDFQENNFGFSGTGLRVCPDCRKKTFYQVYKTIRSNRFCQTPFPITPRDNLADLSVFQLNFLRRVIKEYELIGDQPPREVLDILELYVKDREG